MIVLTWELGLLGRGQYVEAGASETDALAGLRCVNELVLAVSQQLRHLLNDASALPDDVFLATLEDKASFGKLLPEFRTAVVRALESIK